ncbi:hypothetical protein SAMN02746065_105165 [Desulfocicer vacuolatum DSM 3385]|uniref:Uncharacterized protein n=1 Tax=Desulfocicer vacuolatum DSM 3385 TaxID=1121400 RepID=A0A1W2AKN4_9BACT|nr:hypothetical protein [Desulfocicer vacuolatum]SMC61062.1 hypothetical protein SAMN02746065_105165 [Desulfocicer vacuolatum DSM 3385]
MLDLKDINEISFGGALLNRVAHYIEEKNLNFIVARGELLNKRFRELGREKVMAYLNDYAGCDFSRITIAGDKPSAPFMAACVDNTHGELARVRYLIDFNEEAKQGTASLFYSKIMGAFSTNFFAVQPHVTRLWFPFTIQMLEGGKVKVQEEDGGSSILK